MKKKIMAMVFAAIMMMGGLQIKSSPQWSNCKSYRLFCDGFDDSSYAGVIMICWDSGGENGPEWQQMADIWANLICQ